jgi:hypothetical protein
VTARTLLGKDGYTTLEITTGSLDSTATPPGNLDKVQFKPLDQFGNAMYAQNFNGLAGGGFYSFKTNVLAHKEQVQLQGNASGIDRNRTDVVTLVETVKYRPDIAVQNLMFPSQAIVNSPVNISANLMELLGDAGATTTCDLYVDSVSVDKTTNVWVDAGGSVSCAFTYTFTSTGSHAIKVAAENVTPADWDTANNSASGTIQIITPTVPFPSYFISYYDYPITYYQSQIDSITYGGTPTYVLNDTNSQSGWQNGSYAQAYVSGSLLLPPFSFKWQELVDGAVAYNQSGSQTYAYSYGCGNAGTCISGSGQLDSGYFYVYGYKDSSYTYTQFWGTRYAGDVTYFSQGYECYYWSGYNCQAGQYYTWNTSGHSAYGTRVGPPSSNWGVNIGLTDSTNTTYSLIASTPVYSTGSQTYIQGTNPCTAYTLSSGGYNYSYCDYFYENYTLVYGSASQ